MALGTLKRLIRQDVALDLGTANTLIFLQGEGIVLDEPTVVAFDHEANVLSHGEEAKRFLGKNPPDIKVVRPLKNGVIDDFEAVGLFLKTVVEAARRIRPVFSSRIVMCVPSQLTQVEKRALLEAGQAAGFRKIYLLEEVMAAAIGAGMDISDSTPLMVVDIGGGTTEVAVISEMAYMFCLSRRVAGDEMDRALARFLLEEHDLRIGLNTAERVKWEAGSAPGFRDAVIESEIEIAGQDIRTQIPALVRVTGLEIQDALSETVGHIVASVQDCMAALPLEVRYQVEKRGVLLTGGGSLLRGLAGLLSERMRVRVEQPSSPLTTVVEGAGRTLSDFDFFSPVFVN